MNSGRKNKKRVPIEFSKEAYEKLAVLQELTDVTSNAEVIRNALCLYDFLVRQKKDGWALQLVKDDQVKELLF